MSIQELKISPDDTPEQFTKKFSNYVKDIFKYVINPMSVEMNNTFQLRKKAYELKNTKHKQVGSLDMTKIYAYKTSDDLFKRKTWKPQGKSHGIVIMVDFSGSMNRLYFPCLINAAAITIFCKKNNIPCKVATFTTNSLTTGVGNNTKNNKGMNKKDSLGISNSLSSILLFSNDMSINTIMSNFLSIFISITGYSFLSAFPHGSPKRINLQSVFNSVPKFNMSSTPLSLGMWCGIDMAMDIKQKAQQVTLITISDGDGNHQFTTGRFMCPYNNEIYTFENVKHKSGKYELKSPCSLSGILEPLMMNTIAHDLGINTMHVSLGTPSSVISSAPINGLVVPKADIDNITEHMKSEGYFIDHGLLSFDKTIFINDKLFNSITDNIHGVVYPNGNKVSRIQEKEEKIQKLMSNMKGISKVLGKRGSDMNIIKEISRSVVEEICKWYR